MFLERISIDEPSYFCSNFYWCAVTCESLDSWKQLLLEAMKQL